jgi:hypothetical protein
MSDRHKRLLIALTIAPLTPGLIFLLASANTGGFLVLAMSAAVGYPAMILLGLPAHLALIRLGMVNPSGYAIAGLLIGALGGLLFIFFDPLGFRISKSLVPLTLISTLSGLAGTASAIVFCAIARPDI